MTDATEAIEGDRGPVEQSATGSPKRPRRWIGWVIAAVVVVVALLVVGFIAGERFARTYATDRVKDELVSALGLESASAVAVDLGDGSILLQALRGSFERIEVEARGARFGDLVGDLDVIAQGVPVRSGEKVETLRATYSVAAGDVDALRSFLSGVELERISLREPEILAESTLSVLGLFAIPVSVGLTPSVVDGELAFDPTTLTIGEIESSVAELRDRFGALGEALLSTRVYCVAEYLPESFRVTTVSVARDELVLTLDGDGTPLSASALATKGTCPAG